MMNTILKDGCTFLICFCFQGLLFAQSIAPDAFDRGKSVEEDTTRAHYLLKNDGTRIEGDKMEWKSGGLNRKEAVMDGKAYPTKELKGARIGNGYFANIDKQLARRIVRGKINVYALGKMRVVADRDSYHQTANKTVSGYKSAVQVTYTYYSQMGEDGEIKKLDDIDDIRKLLSDCPAALSMLDTKNEEVKKALKKEGGYLNKVFEVYNNGCQPVAE